PRLLSTTPPSPHLRPTLFPYTTLFRSNDATSRRCPGDDSIPMNRRQLLMFAGLAPLAAATAPVVAYFEHRSRPRRIRPVTGFHADYFPNVVLRTQDDRRVRLYDDLLRGKSVLVNFFYANCKDGICPVTTQNLVRVQRLLGERCGRDVFMYSFSLAPEQDTPARL